MEHDVVVFFMIKIQQLLLLFCICPFNNVNKIIAWTVYILNNKKTFPISITISYYCSINLPCEILSSYDKYHKNLKYQFVSLVL